MQETQIRFLCWEDPLEKEMTTHSSVFGDSWRISGQRSLARYSPCGLTESDTAEQLTLTPLAYWGDLALTPPGGSNGKESVYNLGDLSSILGWEGPLEEGMATHSNILAWRIPWTEEPGRLQSMGSHRVGQDWVIKHIPLTYKASMVK